MYPVVYCRYIPTTGCSRKRGETEIYGWLILKTDNILKVARKIIKGKYRDIEVITKARLKELKYV